MAIITEEYANYIFFKSGCLRIACRNEVITTKRLQTKRRDCGLRFEHFMQRRARTRREGSIMPTNLESKNFEELLAEADELIEQINSDVIKHMKEEDRLQFEIHAQNLKKIKSEVQGKIENQGGSELGSGAEGMHAAILDIVKAMHDFTKYIS
jgi:hypothetical protein